MKKHKKNLLTSRVYRAFLASLENDAAIDNALWYMYMGDNPYADVPRPSKCINYAHKLEIFTGISYRKSIKFIRILLEFFWVLIMPLVCIYKIAWILPSIFRLRGCTSKNIRCMDHKTIGIDLNNRLKKILTETPGAPMASCILDLKKMIMFFPAHNRYYSYIRVTLPQLYWASIISYQISRHIFQKKHSCIRFQAYDIFTWVLFYIFLKDACQKSEKILFSNHFDRWACLLDRLPICVCKTLVQHGLMPSEAYYKGKMDRLPCPLRNIDEFYGYNENELMNFSRLMSSRRPNFNKLELTLKIEKYKITNRYRYSVLLVGDVGYEAMEYELLNHLIKNTNNVVYFYKKHPVMKKTPEIQKILSENFVLLTDTHALPVVSLVLTRASTVGAAFENRDVTVIWDCHEKIEYITEHIRQQSARLSDNSA